MQPIGSFILKATSTCNLNCSYCYMFNLADRSYLGRPRIMPPAVVEASAHRITQYAVANALRAVPIIIHGGEPLLAGRDWVRTTVRKFRDAAAGRVDFRFHLQTNGALVDAEWLRLFRELRIAVALSMDGPPEVHDRARVYHSGRGSYNEVVRGLRMLLDAHDSDDIFAGLLCVVNPADNGLEVYRHFRNLGVTRLDFLWPLQHNWDRPPPEHDDPDRTPYADYLIPIFDDWFAEGNPRIALRYFFDVIKLIFGATRHLDSLGGGPVALGVIESDGSLEPLDALRSCGDGFTQTRFNVLHDPILALYGNPLFRVALSGQAGLSTTCQSCALHDICGGGYLPNRYSAAHGFDNPSVYCRDLTKLMAHILDSVTTTRGRPATGVVPLSVPGGA